MGKICSYLFAEYMSPEAAVLVIKHKEELSQDVFHAFELAFQSWFCFIFVENAFLLNECLVLYLLHCLHFS